jgi:DNA-binding winged helix-turn-helix (wHTH) protein
MDVEIGSITVEETSGDYRGPEGVGRLQPKVLAVVRLLVDRPDEVVTKADLLERVWADGTVGENVLAQAISELRRVLGADAIETIPRIGYRLRAPVNRPPTPSAAGPTLTDAGPAARPMRFSFWQIVVLLLVAGWVLRILILAVQGKGPH